MSEEHNTWAKLTAPFPPAAISWRVGTTSHDKTKGLALAYIDARDVMRRLDEVFGPAYWSDSYHETPKGRIICTISLRMADGTIVSKSDAAGDTDVEGEKGAISDAFKRAAVKWGIGRYLYDIDSPWVALEPMGKSYKIKESEYARLEKILGGKSRAPQTAPQEKPKPAFVPAAIPVGVTEEGKSDWRKWANALKAQIDAAPTPDALHALMKANEAPLITLKETSTVAHDALFKAAATRFTAKE